MRDGFTGVTVMSLAEPRAGQRILYRVRLHLLDEWRANDSGIWWRDALDDAVGVVDACLTMLRRTRRV